MAGKTQGNLDTSAGKVVGGLDKSSLDDAADAVTTGYDDSYSPPSSSYDDSSYGGGSSSSSGHGETGTGPTDDDTETPQDEADDTPEPDGDVDEDASNEESPGGNGPEDEGSGDGETWTQPDDDNRTGNEDGEQDGGGGDNDRPDGWVSIDIQAMTMLVAAMERARDQIPVLQDESRRILGDVELVESSVPEADRLGQVTAWIDDELPGLRRRLAMAQELEGGGGDQHDRPELRKPVEYDVGLVVDHQPHVSRDRARTAASSLTTQPDGGEAVDQLIATLTGNQYDPYFAHELTTQTDPDTVATVIDDARAGSADPGRVDQLANLLRATVRTAARGTGELAPADGFEERWVQFASAGNPAITRRRAQETGRPGWAERYVPR